MVLLIAGIPALIVILVGWYTKSKWRTRVAALIAAAVGVLTGSPIYATLDVAFVVIGYLLAMKFVADDTPVVKEPPKSAWQEAVDQSRIEREKTRVHFQELQASRERKLQVAEALRAKLAAEKLAKAAIAAARKPNAPRGE